MGKIRINACIKWYLTYSLYLSNLKTMETEYFYSIKKKIGAKTFAKPTIKIL